MDHHQNDESGPKVVVALEYLAPFICGRGRLSPAVVYSELRIIIISYISFVIITMAGGEEIRDIYSDKFQICAHITHVRKSQICTLQGSNLSKIHFLSPHQQPD